MQKKVNLAMLALFSCSLAMAQNEKTDQNIAQGLDENAFTFSEAQLGEDDEHVIQCHHPQFYQQRIREPGRLPVLASTFPLRAFNQKYNDVYMNGALP